MAAVIGGMAIQAIMQNPLITNPQQLAENPNALQDAVNQLMSHMVILFLGVGVGSLVAVFGAIATFVKYVIGEAVRAELEEIYRRTYGGGRY